MTKDLWMDAKTGQYFDHVIYNNPYLVYLGYADADYVDYLVGGGL